jgi:hypothetical protein
MARISNFPTDTNISAFDILVGSEYNGVGANNRPIYVTKNYRIGDLSSFFGLNSDSINSKLAYFGEYDSSGNLISMSSAFASQTLSTVAGAGYASATSVSQLSANVATNYSTTSASTTQINQAVATETSARASAVTSLNSSISLKPNTIRATSAPTITQRIVDGSGNITTAQDPAMGSLWIDISTTAVTDSSGVVTQEPKNEMYVLAGAAGSAAWTLTKDASLLNTVTSLATAEQSLTTVSDAQSATATFATGLASNFGTVNATTGVFTDAAGVANQILNTSSNNLFAKSSFVNNLVTTFGSTDVDGNLTINSSFADSVLSTQTSGTLATAQSVTDLTSTVNLKPNIFKQASVPTALAAKDVWFDSDDNNKIYVATALGNNAIASNQWVLTTDPRVTHSFTYTSDATESMGTISTAAGASATKITNLAADYGTFDGSGNFTPGLSAAAGAAITATVNAAGAAATAVNSLNASLNKVITATSQPEVNDVNIPVGSIWVDTSTGKNYILTSGSPNTWNHTTDTTMASVTQLSTAIAGVDGKLEANYGIKVNAGGAMAGFELLAQESGGTLSTSYSEVRFQADKFKISTNNNTTASITPFSVSGNAVTMSNVIITGALDGATGTFDGDLSGASGTFAGVTINSNGIAGTGFTLNASGLTATSGSFTGVVNATSGSFAGDISAATGTFGGNLSGGSITVPTTSPLFSVTSAGALTATSANITGDISATTLSLAAGITIGKAVVGLGNIVNSNFDANGNVIGGTIGGITIGSTKLYHGAGNPGNADTGFYLDSGGNFSLRNKLVFNGSTGDIVFTGSITGSSGTIGGTSLGVDGIINSTAQFALTSTGLVANAGTIGGWDISSGNLSSETSDIILDPQGELTFKDGSNIRVQINNDTTVPDPATISAGVVTPSGGIETASANFGSYTIQKSGQLAFNVSGQAQRVFRTSGSTTLTVGSAVQGLSVTYTTAYVRTFNGQYKYNTPNTAAGNSFNGSMSCSFGLAFSTSQTASDAASRFHYSTISNHSVSFSGGTSGQAHPGNGNLAVSGTFTWPAQNAIYVHPYIINMSADGFSGGNEQDLPSYNSPTATNFTFYVPGVSENNWTFSTIITSLEKSVLSGGGLLVSKDSSNFFRVNRNVSSGSDWANNFIHTKMYAWKHEGRMGILDANGSGDLVVGQMGASGTGDYLRIHSTTSHKYIDYQGGNLIFRAGSNTKGTLTSSGVWSTSGGGTSDFRKKQNIEYISSNVTEAIKQLRPVKFEFKDYPEKQRRGFIAQDVLGVMPDLVLGDGNVEGGTYGLDYDGILALVVKGFKEQQAIIESQKTLIDNLTERVTALEG